MVAIPKVNLLEMAVEMGEVKSLPRPYIGYSSIGHPCNRALWYDFHWCSYKTYSKRVERIFEHGNWEEDQIIADLKKVGVAVNCYQGEVIGPAGHVRGHLDAVAHNIPGCEKTIHVFEAKTANDTRFKTYLKLPLDANNHANDRLKAWSMPYYCQVQAYMGKLDFKRALFIVTNKNTEQRVYDRVHFDKIQFEIIEEKALHILLSESPPFKLNENPSWFECKFCTHKKVCHYKETPLRNCRTCKYSCIEDKGKWSCDKHNDTIYARCQAKGKVLGIAQEDGCDDYDIMECL